MISKILVALFILVLLLIVMLLYFFISDEKKRNILSENNNGSLDEQSDGDSDAEPETLYNEAPIHWLKLPYKRSMMPNIIHPNDDSVIYKNIVIVEHSFAFQKILSDYLGDEFNLFFFDDGQDWIEHVKSSNNNLIHPDLFILSDHCNIISGIQLFRIHKRHNPSYLAIPHIITSTNLSFYVDDDYYFVGKPFDKEYLLKIVHKAIKSD